MVLALCSTATSIRRRSPARAGPRYSVLVVAVTRERPSSSMRLTPWPVVMSISAREESAMDTTHRVRTIVTYEGLEYRRRVPRHFDRAREENGLPLRISIVPSWQFSPSSLDDFGDAPTDVSSLGR